jgi:hypothetical protein
MPVDKMHFDALARGSTIYMLRSWRRPQKGLGGWEMGVFWGKIRHFYINDGNILSPKISFRFSQASK